MASWKSDAIGCVLVTSGAQAAQFVLNGTLNAFLPLYGREVLGLTAPSSAGCSALQTLTTLAVRPAIGFALRSRRAPMGHRDRVDGVQRRGVVALAGNDRIGCSSSAVIAYAAGVATTTAATSAYITDVTRRARYGAAHGVFGTIYDVGDALGPDRRGPAGRRGRLRADVSDHGRRRVHNGGCVCRDRRVRGRRPREDATRCL